MADYREQLQSRAQAQAGAQARPVIDEGLRSYMLGIYNYMASALAVTGITALGVANLAISNPAIGQAMYGTSLRWVIMLAPLAFILVLSFGIHKMSKATMTFVFYAFSAVMGVSLASVFLVFTATSIAQTFFVTAAAFGCLSLYGYTTKKNLSGWGSFLIMGVFGLIIASIVNIFLASSALQFAISVIGVLVFAGLTAYDTQRLKHTYDVVAGNAEMMAKSSIMGALSLYLNFVNMFQFLLSFMGSQE